MLFRSEINPFRPGAARILGCATAPVVPMALSGLWGSILSRSHGRILSRPWKLRPFMKIGLRVGAPVPAEQASLQHLQSLVGELRGTSR